MSKTVVKIGPSVDLESHSVAKIEFTHILVNLSMKDTNRKPEEFKNVELILEGYQYNAVNAGHIGKHDLMLAYDDSRSQGALFVGQFNDGVVEETK